MMLCVFLERERVDRERRSVVVDVKWCYDVMCVLREGEG